MNLIGLSSVTQDEAGAAMFRATSASDFEAYSRRASRFKTLDGGVASFDGGFSHGDRTLDFSIDYSEDLWTVLFHLHSSYSVVYLSLQGAFYRCTIKELGISGGKIVLKIWIYAKMDS